MDAAGGDQPVQSIGALQGRRLCDPKRSEQAAKVRYELGVDSMLKEFKVDEL